MKAKKTGFVIREKYSDFVEYEYRGYTYEVEYGKGMDYLCISPKVQHEVKQAEIDKLIERKRKPKPYKYENTAEYGFNLFWEYVEGGNEKCQ